jgi:hypothetical protein
LRARSKRFTDYLSKNHRVGTRLSSVTGMWIVVKWRCSILIIDESSLERLSFIFSKRHKNALLSPGLSHSFAS